MPVPEEPMPPAVPDIPNYRSASEFAPIPPAPSEPSSGKGTGTVLSEFRYLLRNTPPLIVAMMILSVVGMNLMANKSIDTGLDWLALDCGILFSWMCFLSMDVLTRCFGPRATTLLSIVALIANWVMALLFFIASVIPGVWSESYVEGSEAVIIIGFGKVF